MTDLRESTINNAINPSIHETAGMHLCSRRCFLQCSAGMAAAVSLGQGGHAWAAQSEAISSAHSGQIQWTEKWNPDLPFIRWGKTLRVQPMLMYATPTPKKETSWRSWGGVLDDASATEEAARITNELKGLAKNAEFPLEILPLQKIKTSEDAAKAKEAEADVVLVYPASGSGRLLKECVPQDGDTILFVRHRSGPVYYWYEALSVAYLDTDDENTVRSGPPALGKTHVDDVVVDDYDDVLWRLRALYGVKNLKNTRMLALGGVWGKYAGDAPQMAKDKFGFDIVEIGYDKIEDTIRNALNDKDWVDRAKAQADAYLKLPNTTLETEKPFVVNAFILYDIFKNLMQEYQAPAFTIRNCMSVIIPMSKTTACLTLGLLNDEGLIAFCESDFVILPPGVLLRHITGQPVFMHNSTFPHKGIVTCAHCSAPRRMDGVRYEPTRIQTHEESDFGAAPKVEIPIGQQVTFIDPEYTSGRWVGMRGNVEDNPFLPICRSQQDVRIQGNWKELVSEVRDSHWMMVYGDYLKEAGYAARKLGMKWDNISDV